MKKLLLLSTVLLSFTITKAQTASPAGNMSQTDINKVIEFKDIDHDFGKIPYGKPAEYELVMKNISDDTVRLQNVQAGCGCTTPKWEAGPYKPGETFKITIGFNGYGISSDGSFNKIVTIYLTNGLSQVVKFHGMTYKTPDNPAPGNSALQKLKSSTSGN